MISFWPERDQNCLTLKSPLAFFVNLFKKKKYKVRKNNVTESVKADRSPKVPKVLSVSVMDMRMSSPCPLSPALSTLTLTPGRTRDIDQDMEALRLSRQDNPFLQVLASRESLVESLFESESDDINLMSQDFPADLEIDPFSLPEIHEHMIRSPPPTTWPKSPTYKVFKFPVPGSQECLEMHSNIQGKSFKKSQLNAVSSNSIKDDEDLRSKDLKFNEITENTIGSHSTTLMNSPSSSYGGGNSLNWSNSESKESVNSVFPTFKQVPLKSHSDFRRLQSHKNFEEKKLESIERRIDEEDLATLPLLIKKFT